MTDLTSLIEKLQKAGGPDRELDCQIAVAVDGFYELPPKWEGGPVGYGYTDAEGTPIHPGHGGDQLVRQYTLSIDAAASLAKRVLPNWQINLSIFHDTLAEASFGNREAPHARSLATKPALAICLATLRALQQKGGTE